MGLDLTNFYADREISTLTHTLGVDISKRGIIDITESL